ncbi:MAG: glycosyltransferase family 2 protein, partial [Anaerolineae bacterium]|nr:glycosyltransferase family 2 protein [Anaerolineae bacterium]
IISHKFSRPLVPFAMIIAFLANIFAFLFPTEKTGFFALAPSWAYLLLVTQILFYALAILGKYINGGIIGKVLYLPTFLVNSNWAALKGFWRFSSRGQSTLWERVQRREEKND